jgi:hypothetical protein
MQLNHIGIARDANIRPVRHLPTDLCAIGSSGWTRSVGQSWRSMLLVLVIVVAAARGSTSALRVIVLYQGWFVLSKGVGESTSFVVTNFTRAQLRRLPTDGRHTGKSFILADTCLAPLFIGS